jgi:hypothetical protein
LLPPASPDQGLRDLDCRSGKAEAGTYVRLISAAG